MSTNTQVLASAALSTTGIAAAVAWSASGYALTASGAADGMSHPITFLNKTATTHVGQTITFTGTDENGRPISQTITGPAGSVAVATTAYFQTVTSVTASATTGADTFDIGWAAASQSPWIFPRTDIGEAPFNIGVGCTVVSGNPNYSLKYTYDGSAWFTHAVITGKTASQDGSIVTPITAYRFDFTVAGNITVTSISASRM